MEQEVHIAYRLRVKTPTEIHENGVRKGNIKMCATTIKKVWYLEMNPTKHVNVLDRKQWYSEL